MSIEAEKFADEASDRWEHSKHGPATDRQIALIHKLLDEAPLSKLQASGLINKLADIKAGRL